MSPNEPRAALTRRGLLGASAVAATSAVAVGGASSAASAKPVPKHRRGEPGTSGVRLRWLGNNSWEIAFGDKVVLIDPWLTRFQTGTYTPEGAREDTPLEVDPAKIDPYVSRADLILVCQGHYDHMTDVPYIAEKTGATVLGTESHVNMLKALGAPAKQLSPISGGAFLNFDGFTVQAISSLHSMVGEHRQVPIPGTRPGAVPPRPETIADLVEGETLCYQITVGDRFRIFNMSTANYIESELEGLRPDLALVAAGGGTVYEYVDRLMRTLDHPTWVVPTHWDDFDHPLDEPAVDWGGLAPLRDAVGAASPDSAFVVLDHLDEFTP